MSCGVQAEGDEKTGSYEDLRAATGKAATKPVMFVVDCFLVCVIHCIAIWAGDAGAG